MNRGDEDTRDQGRTLESLLRLFETGLFALTQAPPGDIDAQVEQRQGLAEKLGLGQRLLRIYDEFKFVPGTRRPVLTQWGCVVHGLDINGAERTTSVRFEFKQHPYVLTFRETPAGYEAVRACLDIRSDRGDLLFTVRLEFDPNEWGHGWAPRAVEAFVPGDWVKDVLEVSTLLEGDHDLADTSPNRQDLEALKRRFGL